MAISYNQLKTKVEDIMRDANFSTTREDETLRAINSALDDINIGLTQEDRGSDLEVGYDFQKRIASVSFTSGTTNYSFSTLSITDFKFPSDLRINSDENVRFVYQDNNYFFEKKGVYSSGEYMYTVWWKDGTQYLKINYDTTDTMDFEYFDNAMVLNGSTRQAHFSDENNSAETILIPDRYMLVVVHLAAGELYKMLMGLKSNDFNFHLAEGMKRLKHLISSIGFIRKVPMRRPKIRSEWSAPLNLLDTV